MSRADLDVLEANASFYRAFQERDADAMDALWAEEHAVACIHPGWDVLDTRADVVASWRNILESEGAPDLACSAAEARVVGDVAWVTCHEVMEAGRLAATNLFVREHGAWRLVHHQATPIAPGQLKEAPPRRGPVN